MKSNRKNNIDVPKKWIFIGCLVVLLFLPLFSLTAQSTAPRGGSDSDNGEGYNSYSLTVRSNVEGAEVFINGSYRGTTPIRLRVSRGTYRIIVKAQGYYDYSETVRIQGSRNVYAELVSPNRAKLTITSNVEGASVFIDRQYRGKTPYLEIISTGSHRVRISAPGYQDYVTTVDIKRTTSVHANLESHMAKVLVENSGPELTIFLDGRRVSSKFEVAPGRHTLRFAIGAFTVERTYTFEGGKTYRVQPRLIIDFDY